MADTKARTRNEETLWKIRARFPAHCGQASYIENLYYAGTFQTVMAMMEEQYVHAEFLGAEKLGLVWWRTEIKSSEEVTHD